LNNTFECKNQF